jgi:hypothetical protein
VKRDKVCAPPVIYSQDGDKRCATRPGFVDLQESPAGFGETDAEALADLERNEKGN